MARLKQQAFSISAEYEEVIGILKNMPNKSKFVCEAVLEKYNRETNPHSTSPNIKDETKNTISFKSNEDLKDIIREVLGEMLEKDTFLVKGNINNIPSIEISSQIYNSFSNDEKIKKEKIDEVMEADEEVSEDTLNQMKNVFNNW